MQRLKSLASLKPPRQARRPSNCPTAFRCPSPRGPARICSARGGGCFGFLQPAGASHEFEAGASQDFEPYSQAAIRLGDEVRFVLAVRAERSFAEGAMRSSAAQVEQFQKERDLLKEQVADLEAKNADITVRSRSMRAHGCRSPHRVPVQCLSSTCRVPVSTCTVDVECPHRVPVECPASRDCACRASGLCRRSSKRSPATGMHSKYRRLRMHARMKKRLQS